MRARLVAAAALVGGALAGCTPAAMPVTAEHPASPEAPAGRLAGPPPALRPGVADATPPAGAPAPTPRQHQHQEPPQQAPQPMQQQPPKPAASGHEGHH